MMYLHVQGAEEDTCDQIRSTGFLDGADVQKCEYVVIVTAYKFICMCMFFF